MKIKQPPQSKKKIILIVAALAVLIAAGFGFLYIQQKNATERAEKFGSENTKPTENIPKPVKQESDKPKTATTPAIGSTKESATTAPAPDSTIPPATPVGTFASNHRPNISGAPMPNSINSTCTTTPGVICTIQFSNDSTTVSLTEKVTDSNGNATWDWKLQDINITQGVWTITAIAKNGTKTTTNIDPIKLEVKP